ncbi:hypothetical protein ACK356_01320 [Aeromonas veronii]
MKNDILWSILFLFIIYNVKYVFLFGLGTSHLIILIMAILALLIKTPIKLTNFLCLVCVLITSLVSIFFNFNSGFDLIYLRFSIFTLVSLVATSTIIKIFEMNKRSAGDFFKFYGYAGFINSVFIFVMFLSVGFKDFYLNFLNLEITEMLGDSVMDSMLALRMVGVTGFSAYATAFNQMLCVFLYYIYATEYRVSSSKLLAVDYFLIFSISVSSLIVSRSTIVGLGLVFILMLMDRRNLSKNMLFLAVALLMLTAAFSSLSFFMTDEQFLFFSNWALEFFNKGLETGSLESNLSMYKYSWDDFSLFGDARMNDQFGGYYMHTDVGYFRILFSVGYIGIIILFIMIFTVLRPVREKINNKATVFSFLILMYVFIFLLKGSIVTDSSHIIITLLLCSYVLSSKKNEGKF